jgi:hypothetical protein
MRVAAELRKEVESALAGSFPSALSQRPAAAPELCPSGIAEVDAVLGGGLPVGAITELSGAYSSGRTTLALSTLAGLTRQGESCAYVDLSDALDPLSAAAMGAELCRLLWVRIGEAVAAGARPREARSEATGFATASAPAVNRASATAAAESRSRFSPGWRHPRSEAIGLHHAVGELFHAEAAEPDFSPRCAEAKRRPRVQPVLFTPMAAAAPQPGWRSRKSNAPWTRLDQALRAADLLLNAGGFRAIVLDMSDLSPEQARRVPLATWYRFRLQAEKSRTLLLLLSQLPCAHSCAALSLHCEAGEAQWGHAAEASPALLDGMRYRLSVERNRAADFGRKPPVSAAGWSGRSCWPG